ncbi:hypothetical protein ACA910_014160 [Epithemia clementina (nom. ined.)]
MAVRISTKKKPERRLCRKISFATVTLLLLFWFGRVLLYVVELEQGSKTPSAGGQHVFHEIQVAENNRVNPPVSTPLQPKVVSVKEGHYICEPQQGLFYVQNIPTTASGTARTSWFSQRRQPTNTRIPKQVFQTSKSKCVVSTVAQATELWKFGSGWGYYLYDDTNVDQFFQDHANDFPLLGQISKNCFVHGALKADLWRYLVLWVYGGVYADIDSRPNKQTKEMILRDDYDALFVLEQYHLLSQFFIAISPGHPLMAYAIQKALQNVLLHDDVQKINAAFTTGPHALHEAFRQFRSDAGAWVDPAVAGKKPVQAGTFVGTDNRTVTVVGVADHQNEYITRDYLSFGTRKARAYIRMGMQHFLEDARSNASGTSCRQLLYDAKKG